VDHLDPDYAGAALGLNQPMRNFNRRNPHLLECKVQHNHILETASDMVRFQSGLITHHVPVRTACSSNS